MNKAPHSSPRKPARQARAAQAPAAEAQAWTRPPLDLVPGAPLAPGDLAEAEVLGSRAAAKALAELAQAAGKQHEWGHRLYFRDLLAMAGAELESGRQAHSPRGTNRGPSARAVAALRLLAATADLVAFALARVDHAALCRDIVACGEQEAGAIRKLQEAQRARIVEQLARGRQAARARRANATGAAR